jgi:AcrR family transcriptional regulator
MQKVHLCRHERLKRRNRSEKNDKPKFWRPRWNCLPKKGSMTPKYPARAGVSQGTVYWYFDSKEELFEAAFMSQFDALVEPLYAVIEDEERSAAENLLAVATASIDLFGSNTEIVFLMLQVMATQEVANILSHDIQDYYEQFKVIITPLFEELGDPDPVATTSAYIAMLDGLMLQCLLGPDWFDRDRVIAQIKAKFNLQEG